MSLAPRNRHRVELAFEGGYGVAGKLIHPPGGCVEGMTCAICGHDYGDTETEPCYDCKGAEQSECWITGWFDNASVDELLHGSVTVDVEAVFEQDHIEINIVPPVVTDTMVGAFGDALLKYGYDVAAFTRVSPTEVRYEQAGTTPAWETVRGAIAAALAADAPALEGTGS